MYDTSIAFLSAALFLTIFQQFSSSGRRRAGVWEASQEDEKPQQY
jgi:hypothetical protein